jgi:hypothetical protein
MGIEKSRTMLLTKPSSLKFGLEAAKKPDEWKRW